MLYVANKVNYFDIESIKNFSCKNLQDIDSLWVKHSDGRFGFSVQKKVWLETGNRLGIYEWTKKDDESYLSFASVVGWYNKGQGFYEYNQVINVVEKNITQQALEGTLGTLPYILRSWRWSEEGFVSSSSFLFSRVASCEV